MEVATEHLLRCPEPALSTSWGSFFIWKSPDIFFLAGLYFFCNDRIGGIDNVLSRTVIPVPTLRWWAQDNPFQNSGCSECRRRERHKCFWASSPTTQIFRFLAASLRVILLYCERVCILSSSTIPHNGNLVPRSIQHVYMLLKQQVGVEKQVVKIHGPALKHRFLVKNLVELSISGPQWDSSSAANTGYSGILGEMRRFWHRIISFKRTGQQLVFIIE